MTTAWLHMRLFAWFNLRNLRGHVGRSLAVLLGIALGAAVFTSMRLAIHATVHSFSRSMNLIAGAADATLVRPGGRVSDSLVAALLQNPKVMAASPLLSAYVRPADHEEPFLLIGLDPISDRDLRAWRPAFRSAATLADWIALMTEPDTLMVGEGLAGEFNWSIGQRVTLIHSQNSSKFKIVGILGSAGLGMVQGGRIALCDIATFQEFTGLFGLADRIDVKLAPGAVPETMASLKRLLPKGVVMRSPSASKESGLSMIRAYQFSLTFLSFISLFVGMFLVYSLVALNAAGRRRELAVLRSIGAPARTIFYLFIGEGLTLGLVGWLLALPICSVLVKYLLAGVSHTVSQLFVPVRVNQLVLNPWEVLLSLIVTLAVALLGALQPAREAMQVPPREALNIESSAPIRSGLIQKMALAGLGLLVLAYPVSLLPSPPAVSLPGYLAAMLLLMGFALAVPWGLHQFGRLIAGRLSRLGGQPAFLAARYLGEGGVQATISVGALITAMALFTALVIMVHSFRSTVVLWVTQSIGGDLYIRPKLAELNYFRDPLSPRVVAAIKNLKAPAEVVPIRRMDLRIAGHRHTFEAIDYAAYARHSRFIWMTGNPRQVEAALIAGKGVVVSEVFANTTGLKPGDPYRVQIGARVLDKPILAEFRDYRTQGGVVYYSLAHYRAQFNEDAWNAAQVNFSRRGPRLADEISHVRDKLLMCCGDAIEISDGPSLRRSILQIFDQTFAITTVLLLISLTVAALGIATALSVLVLQRTRQFNTIRAVGGSPAQLRTTILWEAGLLVIAGQAAGLVCGLMLSYLLIFVVNRQSFGWTFLYRIDWHALLLALPLIFATALAAALPAVKLAMRSSPALLLRGEIR
jgi:putative ABC transport system permease protein